MQVFRCQGLGFRVEGDMVLGVVFDKFLLMKSDNFIPILMKPFLTVVRRH